MNNEIESGFRAPGYLCSCSSPTAVRKVKLRATARIPAPGAKTLFNRRRVGLPTAVCSTRRQE
jgi:hypothetical protein